MKNRYNIKKSIKTILTTLTCIVLFLMLFIKIGIAQSAIELNKSTSKYNLGKKIAYYVDPTNSLSLNEVTKKKFTQHKNNIPYFGISRSTFWFTFTITDHEKNLQWFLKLGYEFYNESVE